MSLDANGAWKWASAKPAMHDYVRSYFASRQEDGAVGGPALAAGLATAAAS